MKFENLSPIDKLDLILNILFQKGAKTKQSIASSESVIYGLDQIPISQIESVIDKLLKDGYIREKKYNGSESDYLITFEGEFLVQKGGYKSLYREAEYLKQQVRNSYWLTILVAFGTGMSAVYYFFQLWDGDTKKHPCVAISTLIICFASLCVLEYRRIFQIIKRKL